jgi:phosphoribosyl 1,2-cyclic phosphodiesterase
MEIKVLASGSRGNCYWVTDGSSPILLECGIAWKKIQQGLSFRASELAGCLVTHEHKDHCKAARELMAVGVDLYASAGTLAALGLASHRAHTVRHGAQFQVGGWQVVPFGVEHDAAEPLGFLLASGGERLLYATDTYYLRPRFRSLTHIMIEANYAADILAANVESGAVPGALKDRVLQSHMSLEHLKDFFQANDLSRVREIWLLHLSDGNSDAERFRHEVQELTGKPVYVA